MGTYGQALCYHGKRCQSQTCFYFDDTRILLSTQPTSFDMSQTSKHISTSLAANATIRLMCLGTKATETFLSCCGSEY